MLRIYDVTLEMAKGLAAVVVQIERHDIDRKFPANETIGPRPGYLPKGKPQRIVYGKNHFRPLAQSMDRERMLHAEDAGWRTRPSHDARYIENCPRRCR